MADISADGLLPSGDFTPTFFSGALQVASGASGTVLTIPAPPAGQKIRLYGLAVNSGSEAGMTLNANGAAVVTALTLALGSGSTVGNFCVGVNLAIGGAAATAAIPYLDSRTAITLVKGSGSTANAINYSYAYGF